MLGVASWVEYVAAILGIVATSLVIVGTVATFFKRQIGQMIDAKIEPLYRRLDEHMSSEDEYLERIADAMALLAESWNK